MTTEAGNARALQSEVTLLTRKTVQLTKVAIERFAGWVVVAKIGHGGMAEVFLAMSEGPSNFRKLAVLKRLHGHLETDPESVQMFLDEATVAARLHHPNIVQAYEVGKYREQHFLTMEYLEGQPLDRVLARLQKSGDALPEKLACHLGCEVLDALHYAHEARDYDGTPLGIVHRDVSPHNVFITYDGQVKLLDFGIAKSHARSEQTRTGVIKGKFAYIAPEQARGEWVDRRADVWSMGVTLWSCLTGQRLFRGKNEVELLRAALSDEIPPLSEVAPHLSEGLAEVLRCALRRDCTQRFESALSFRQALEIFRGEPGDNARTALSGLMMVLFHEEMAARKQAIASCFAQVAAFAAERVQAGAQARDSHPIFSQQPLHALAMKEEAPSLLRARVKRGLSGAFLLLVGGVVGMGLRQTGRSEVAAAVPQGAPVAPLPAAASASAPVEVPAAAAPASTLVEVPAAAEGPSAPDKPASKPSALTVPEDSVDHAHAPLSPPSNQAKIAALNKPQIAVVDDALPEPSDPGVDTPQTGHLVLDSVPYAVVSLDGQRLGITPLELDLPPARHTLVLRNPEQALEVRYNVTIRAGESVERRVALE